MSIEPASTTPAEKTVETGDTLQVDYTGKLTDGTVFDTSIKSEAEKAGLPLRPSYSPLEFTVGAGQLIEGFDTGVLGMKEGETKVVTMLPEKAYGQKNANAVMSIPIEKIGNSSSIKVGSLLYAQNGASGKVVEITNGTAKVDFNHELAGKTLVFTIKVISITKG
jgi:FKBP-type peptidyl-prolyl cis-trans isomerase 2